MVPPVEVVSSSGWAWKHTSVDTPEIYRHAITEASASVATTWRAAAVRATGVARRAVAAVLTAAARDHRPDHRPVDEPPSFDVDPSPPFEPPWFESPCLGAVRRAGWIVAVGGAVSGAIESGRLGAIRPGSAVIAADAPCGRGRDGSAAGGTVVVGPVVGSVAGAVARVIARRVAGGVGPGEVDAERAGDRGGRSLRRPRELTGRGEAGRPQHHC